MCFWCNCFHRTAGTYLSDLTPTRQRDFVSNETDGAAYSLTSYRQIKVRRHDPGIHYGGITLEPLGHNPGTCVAGGIFQPRRYDRGASAISNPPNRSATNGRAKLDDLSGPQSGGDRMSVFPWSPFRPSVSNQQSGTPMSLRVSPRSSKGFERDYEPSCLSFPFPVCSSGNATCTLVQSCRTASSTSPARSPKVGPKCFQQSLGRKPLAYLAPPNYIQRHSQTCLLPPQNISTSGLFAERVTFHGPSSQVPDCPLKNRVAGGVGHVQDIQSAKLSPFCSPSNQKARNLHARQTQMEAR